METKVLDKEAEKLEAITQDGTKGVSAAKQIFKEEEHEENEKKAVDLQKLEEAARGKIVTYNFLLAELLLKRLRMNEWPVGWTYQVAPTDVGIIMELRSPHGRYFRSGVRPCGMSLYDLNALDMYAIRAQNTVDKTDQASVISSPYGQRQTD